MKRHTHTTTLVYGIVLVKGGVLSSMALFFFIFIVSSCIISPSYGFDPLDPRGNITIKWDLMQSNNVTNDIAVSVFNHQLYRHVDEPGWKLSWAWIGDEVIWAMQGAEATEQGDCKAFKTSTLPHCCENKPTIVDLLPGAPYNVQTQNCCKGGVLSSILQDPSKYGSTFTMNVGGGAKYFGFHMPENFSIGLVGYTCGKPLQVSVSRFETDKGRRRTQALRTWNVTCMYSQFVASSSPKCCVSLSAFYNSTVVPCPQCSCGCQDQPGQDCVQFDKAPLLLHPSDEAAKPLVRCSRHMCPIRVHWHVKQSYKEYWRVKITIENLNIIKNYSYWNLVVLHPNLQSLTQVFSFNYKPLHQYGSINDTGMFWGLQYYNQLLLQSGKSGNVQTEMLLHKDADTFTFAQGWAFPRRILFNGDECVMPQPDDYPGLPNVAAYNFPLNPLIVFLIFMLVSS